MCKKHNSVSSSHRHTVVIVQLSHGMCVTPAEKVSVIHCALETPVWGPTPRAIPPENVWTFTWKSVHFGAFWCRLGGRCSHLSMFIGGGRPRDSRPKLHSISSCSLANIVAQMWKRNLAGLLHSLRLAFYMTAMFRQQLCVSNMDAFAMPIGWLYRNWDFYRQVDCVICVSWDKYSNKLTAL